MSTSSSPSTDTVIQNGISRLDTLQKMLSLNGAPGSVGCDKPNDLVPVDLTKESADVLADLHPHLYPIAKSQSTNNFVCALRLPSMDVISVGDSFISGDMTPLPIVEGGIGLPGMKLLSLNSEHFMRRMAAEADDSGDSDGIVGMYNSGLGEGKLADPGLDDPYEPGSVAKLGYGPQKYTLLRVGPFPDLYESMAQIHASKNDEPSSLIAAEACNSKFTGFGSTFAFYSKLLSTFPKRDEETKDAARVCLRLPLSTAGLTVKDLANVSRYAALATDDDDDMTALAKMEVMYEKIRKHEQEENDSQSGKTAEQLALDEATYLLDRMALQGGGKWSTIRKELADIYDDADKEAMAKFVDPERD